MSKRGLPLGVGLKHDSHYVEDMARSVRKSVGRVIPIDQIEPNPEQPRTELGDLSELTGSIRQRGVLEPLLVKPLTLDSWMIIAGERRWRASKLAGLTEVPCIELDIDEKSVAEIALIENLQRKDLTIWEEADGLKALIDRFGYTHEEVAKQIGKSRTTVTESLSIAGLPEQVRERCKEAKITAKSSLLEISRQFDESAMVELLDRMQGKPISRENIRRETRPFSKAEKLQKAREEILGEPSRPAAIGGLPAIKELESLVNAPLPNASNRLPADSSRKNLFLHSSREFNLEIKFHQKDGYVLDDVINALKKTIEFWESSRRT